MGNGHSEVLRRHSRIDIGSFGPQQPASSRPDETCDFESKLAFFA